MSTHQDVELGRLDRFLNIVERLGNKLPHITMLFIYALIIAIVLSWALSYIDFDYHNPITKDKIVIINMMSPDNLLNLLVSSINNFMAFPPLGITLVATLGIGIAEGSGFIHILLKKLLSITPQKLLTPAIVVISIFSHLASDSVYVVLMPVAALMFYACGRHPLAGIACSFAGLSGGFTASFTPSVIDPVMQSFTEAAARTVDADYVVNVLCNYFYSLGGTIFVILATWYVTDKIVEPRLMKTMPIDKDVASNPENVIDKIKPEETKAFRVAVIAELAFLLGLAILCYPEDSIFRAEDGSLTSPKAPIMQGLVPILFFVFSIPGLAYGIKIGKFKTSSDVIHSMEHVLHMLLSFIVFAFFAAQFLFVFGKSNIGALLAVSGAEWIKSLGMPSGITLFGIIMLTGLLNILITSATSKWAILSTIFVPMLMLLGISPELTQAAFRVSDSAVNVSTPLFPFYPLLIMYCQRYCRQAGVGTLCSMMIPYTVTLLIVLTVVLYLYWFLNIPIGFDSGYVYPRG